MKARINGKKIIQRDNNDDISLKNKDKYIKNMLILFLTMMEKDGTLKESFMKQIFDSSLDDRNFHFSTPSQFTKAVKAYHKVKVNFLEDIKDLSKASEYEKVFEKYQEFMDKDKLVSSILTEIVILEESGITKSNYDLIKTNLTLHGSKDVFKVCWGLYSNKDSETKEEKPYRIEKGEFTSNPIMVSVMSSEEAELIKKSREDVIKVCSINDLIKVQKPADFLYYIHNNDARFRIMYTYVNYAYFGYDELLFNNADLWENLDDLHRNKNGSLVETKAMYGLFSPKFMSTDELLLVSGYRALECLENNDYPIDKKELLLMCLNIEKELKDKNITLNNKYSTKDFILSANKNEEIIDLKIKSKKLEKSELKELYIKGVTNYNILKKFLSEDELSELFTVEELMDAYKNYKDVKNEESKEMLYRVSKVYRDSNIEYKKQKGDLLDDEYDMLKEKIDAVDSKDGVIDFYKMGILDISAIIQYDDEELTKKAVFEGVLSKSDIELLSDLEMINKRKLKIEIDKKPQSSKMILLQNNITSREKNVKRRFMYSLDPEARSIDVGDGYEVFFINDKAIVIDSLKPDIDMASSTVIISKDEFEESYGLNGFFDSKYLNKRKNGEVSLNKSALSAIKEDGVEIQFSQNWCDAVIASVIGPEEERIRRYDSDAIAEQKRVMKNIGCMLAK